MSPQLWYGWLVRRRLLFLVLAYPAYLLLMGPFYAMDAHGYFNLAPKPVRRTFYLPVAPLYWTMGPDNPYDDYLTWWYNDPNAPETTW